MRKTTANHFHNFATPLPPVKSHNRKYLEWQAIPLQNKSQITSTLGKQLQHIFLQWMKLSAYDEWVQVWAQVSDSHFLKRTCLYLLIIPADPRQTHHFRIRGNFCKRYSVNHSCPKSFVIFEWSSFDFRREEEGVVKGGLIRSVSIDKSPAEEIQGPAWWVRWHA